MQDKEVFVLVATDAAGEGINLQRAHLMATTTCRGTRAASSSASGASTASARPSAECRQCGGWRARGSWARRRR